MSRYYVPPVRTVKFVGDRSATIVIHVVDEQSGNAVREYLTHDSSEESTLLAYAHEVADKLNGAGK
jgi:hypothetical protein